MTILEVYNNLKQMRNPESAAIGIVVDSEHALLTLVKDQMQRGERGGVRKETAKIGRYAPNADGSISAYSFFKNSLNPLAGLGQVDLKLTGDFYNSFFFNKETMEVDSTDSKTEMLKERYGQYIFKLTPESVEAFRPLFNQKFADYFISGLLGVKTL